MKPQVRYALCISVATALLAGCGGSQPPIGAPATVPQGSAITSQPDRGGSWMLPEAKTGAATENKARGPLLYVTNYTYNTVTVYPANAKNPAPIATIAGGLNAPVGDCLDRQGTLYVTNEPISGPGWVTEYPPGKTTPSKVITDGMSTPAFCAIDSNGNLWVTNIGGPNATEYLYGSKKPRTVITKGMIYPVGIAIDHSGNLYIANRARSSYLVVYAPGSKAPSRKITDGITSPVGIAIDASGALYVTNITEKNVEEYMPGEGHPFRTISQGLFTPVAVTVNAKGWLYVANDSQDTVVEFPPESISMSKRHVARGLHGPSGLTLFPPVLP
jgi:hypothetical protein